MVGSDEENKKPHAICIPFPTQGHITPMLKLAILLHHKGFHITFVNTHYNHRRLLKSRGPNSLDGLPDFQFKAIPDGLPESDNNAGDTTQDVVSLCFSTREHCLAPLLQLIEEINESGSNLPKVTSIICDSVMAFALQAAEEIGVPGLIFRTASASSFLCYKHITHLYEKGLLPLKDTRCLTNGYLDTIVDWIPGMINLRLRDFPKFIRTTDPHNPVVEFIMTETARSSKASAIIINTFDALETNVLNALSTMSPPIYTVGPLQLQIDRLPETSFKSIGSSLWIEDTECLRWLDSKEANSVIYVNFGSVTVLTSQQLVEFAWGLANSKKNFLWIIRPDLVRGQSAILPAEFSEEIKDQGHITGWCPQEQVLKHPSVGGFLTHCGWNSILESISSGLPLLCWPFFADQHLNCRYACSEWGIGMEIDNNVKRDEIRSLVKELLDGEKGRTMKKNAMEWKREVEEATGSDSGTSCSNFDMLVKEVLGLSKP